LADDKLRGTTVIAADGQAIGEVARLLVDVESWRVEALQVKLHSEMADKVGAARSVFHAGSIEIPIRLVQSTSDAIVLSVAVSELRRLQGMADEARQTAP
jgi:sporulation protein YlmC with PRC-barrel domain